MGERWTNDPLVTEEYTKKVSILQGLLANAPGLHESLIFLMNHVGITELAVNIMLQKIKLATGDYFLAINWFSLLLNAHVIRCKSSFQREYKFEMRTKTI